MILAQGPSLGHSQDVSCDRSHLESLTGPEGFTSNMAHLHVYWQEASFPSLWASPQGCLSASGHGSWLLPEKFIQERTQGETY